MSEKMSAREFATAENQKKERSSNLELYRIIVMLLIVAHHYVVNSGLTSDIGIIQTDPLSAKSIFLLIFGMWGKTGINCFVLITGYFMCKSNITIKKFLKLLLELMFYKLVIYFIFLISGYEPFSLKALIKAAVPFKSIADNFTGCYLVFFLIIPFLNILIKNMNEKHHRMLIAVLFAVYVVLGSVPKFVISFNYVTWYVVLYLASSYIRLYPNKFFESTRLSGFATLGCVLLSILSVLVMHYASVNIFNFETTKAYFFVSDSNKILAFATGVSSFLFFKNLKMKNSKFINTVSGSTFGVLCIHANSDTMINWLWKTVLNNVGAAQFDVYILCVHAIKSVLAIFVVRVVIDLIRIRVIEEPALNYLSRKIPKIEQKIL